MNGWSIPLFDTRFGEQELEAVLRPLRAGWLTMGEEVIELEAELAAATGARHALAVSNATTALQIACVAAGVRPGDDVLCPTLTFAATANAARVLGARVRLCASLSADDLTIDPDSVAAHITAATRAIVVVHYAGFACDMKPILALAAERSIPVIEDAAHAVFTRHDGKMLGRHGAIGCFSFYSNKNVTCGEGGAVVTDDDELGETLRLLRSHGMTTPTLDRHRRVAETYDVVLPGFNGRMDEMRAALLRAQLRKLPAYLSRRRELFSRYVELFRGSRVAVPFTAGRFRAELADTGVHIMPVLLPDAKQRAQVMAALQRERIQTSIHYPPIHRFRSYRADATGDLLATGDLADRELTLPLYPAMSDEQVEHVAAAVLRAVAHRP